ncbi:MAG TPA: hypothetical protein VM737_04725 [Gemmatimonadota bacterium]|nr:hypothetical protein [Gemmatimonadota bacterium]
MNRVAVLLFGFGAAVACSSDDAGPIEPANETLAIAIASGNGQASRLGTALQDFLVVRVTRGVDGPAVQGVPVRWSVLEGDGRLAVKRFDTDFQGLAAASLFLGGSSGEQIVQAALVEGPAVLFTARATAADPSP